VGLLRIIGIAISLGVDCLAISAGLGSSDASRAVAAFTASMFGLFQFGMALGGMVGGRRLEVVLASPARFAAPILVAAIGVVMITKGIRSSHTTLKLASLAAIVGLAVSTSLDALGAGVALGLLGRVSVSDALVIGVVSVGMSATGFAGGKVLSRHTSIAEDIGGAFLIVLAVVMMLSMR
jgi:putative Mn2+ efflux pump MntP